MSERDWEKELAKIDRQIKSLPEDVPATPVASRPVSPPVSPPARLPSGSPPAARGSDASAGAATKGGPATTTLGVLARLVLATALGVGVLFWPYASRCGPGLAGYLVAVSAVAIGGAWSAVWSWRHRAAKAHLLSLLLVLWGLSLAAIEVLPRVGYAKADPTRSMWICQ
ncbi:MAG: hypothetical protein ACYC3Q_04400 [Gemmatimonadaceae bacterium]